MAKIDCHVCIWQLSDGSARVEHQSQGSSRYGNLTSLSYRLGLFEAPGRLGKMLTEQKQVKNASSLFSKAKGGKGGGVGWGADEYPTSHLIHYIPSSLTPIGEISNFPPRKSRFIWSNYPLPSSLPSSCTAFSQAFTVNWFRWRIPDERPRVRPGTSDPKWSTAAKYWGLGTRRSITH